MIKLLLMDHGFVARLQPASLTIPLKESRQVKLIVVSPLKGLVWLVIALVLD
ncbi:hypothetical protein LVD17_23100 [Fulvivirga ulvae]|uniref:hypothetical protein n=1 Tax=Fulvivirga ulvae TaxID=2904245 RepID=UPI001F28BFA5|nr:hypothetical protein [Fulvivirga ulvae]UII31183.1 hypothetical protein LVD17_23100 [Fulvivirga ulvae]